MITILRRLIGVLLVLAGLAVLVVGGWFARAVGTDGAATFTTTPPADVPVIIDASTNARTNIPLTITATAADDVPITISVATPSDAKALLGTSRYARVTGIDVRTWALRTTREGTTEPIIPATADLWRSQQTVEGSASIDGDLDNAPETMIITVPDGKKLTSLEMTWTNPAWFYQALSLVFAGLLLVLVGFALTLRRPVDSQTDDSQTDDSQAEKLPSEAEPINTEHTDLDPEPTTPDREATR